MKDNFLVLNIGNGIGISVLEAINTFEEINKCKISYSYVEKRNGDIPIVIADNKKALSLLNWNQKEILTKCVEMHGIGKIGTQNGYE